MPRSIHGAEPALAEQRVEAVAIDRRANSELHDRKGISALVSLRFGRVAAVAQDDIGDKSTLEHRTGTHGPVVGGERVSLVLFHRDGAKVVPLFRDKPVVVGRAWPADAVLEDPSLSRKHAEFVWEDAGVFALDLGSTNGTLCRGVPITDRTRIAPGESVVLGAVTASLHVAQPRGPTLEGIEGHDRFVQRLDDELVRARRFGRPLAVIMMRALAREGHVAQWLPRVRRELRDVDRVAVYGERAVWILMPETDPAQALTKATSLCRGALGEPLLRAGVAIFPDAGAHAEELVAAARDACRRATDDERAVAAGEVSAQPDAPLVLSPKMIELYEMIDRVAPSHLPVLIRGETGSGKELIARALHLRGTRRDAPLRSINCGAIPGTLLESVLFGHEKGAFTGADAARAGVFEEARGGTVFLDEVGELSPAAQAALLRVLEAKTITRVGAVEERAVDVRIVAATHRDLQRMSSEGGFREDLYFRLNGVTLVVPALRERPEEILPLAERFLAEAAPGKTLGADVRRRLMDHAWPGNVRELRNVIERAGVLSRNDEIGLEDLPEALTAGIAAPPPNATASSQPFKNRNRHYEMELIIDALRRAEGNQTAAAKLLGMPLRTLVHKIKQYGIKKKY